MALVKIPLSSDLPNYSVATDLDGTTYTFKLLYNTRDGFWFLSMFDESLSPIFLGYRLVLGVNYFDIAPDDRFPAGALQLVNFDDENTECGRFDLGVSCFLLYGYKE